MLMRRALIFAVVITAICVAAEVAQRQQATDAALKTAALHLSPNPALATQQTNQQTHAAHSPMYNACRFSRRPFR
jgi:hypothetical protein